MISHLNQKYMCELWEVKTCERISKSDAVHVGRVCPSDIFLALCLFPSFGDDKHKSQISPKSSIIQTFIVFILRFPHPINILFYSSLLYET